MANPVQRLLCSWDQLHTQAGLLTFRRDEDDQTSSVPVLPQAMKQQVLSSLHNGMGHLGFNRTLHLVKSPFYWTGMHGDVKAYMERCKHCTLRKCPDSKRCATLQNIRTSGPLQLVCIDFLSLERSLDGYELLLVVYFTCHAQAYPMRDQKATTVARVLWQKYIVNYGIPEQFHSD